MYGTETMDSLAISVTTEWNDVIRRHRDLLDLSREQLAARIRVSAPAIEKWEMTDTRPSRANAEKLDEALAAGGAIMAACGYPQPVNLADVVDRQGKQVATLRDQLGELTRQVQELSAIVDDLRRRPL